MTILIFKVAKEPSYIEQTTLETFQTLFPQEKVEFSVTLDTFDLQSSSNFTLIIPGGDLPETLLRMNENGTLRKCREAVDNGANYIGFCTGAFLGASEFVATKRIGQSEESLSFTYSFNSFDLNGMDAPLDIIEGTCAVGPFMTHSSAQIGEMGRCYTSTAHLVDSRKNSFQGLYAEGPFFLDKTTHKLYSAANNILAHYKLNYPLQISLYDYNRKKQSFEVNLRLGNNIPGVLYEEKKGSHRYLFGPHIELTPKIRTFLPGFEKRYSRDVLNPLSDYDRNALLTERNETESLNFLKEAFKTLKL